MPSIEVKCVCSECGKATDGSFSAGGWNDRSDLVFTAEPCEECLDSARKEGREERDDEADALEATIEELKDRISELEATIAGATSCAS